MDIVSSCNDVNCLFNVRISFYLVFLMFTCDILLFTHWHYHMLIFGIPFSNEHYHFLFLWCHQVRSILHLWWAHLRHQLKQKITLSLTIMIRPLTTTISTLLETIPLYTILKITMTNDPISIESLSAKI